MFNKTGFGKTLYNRIIILQEGSLINIYGSILVNTNVDVAAFVLNLNDAIDIAGGFNEYILDIGNFNRKILTNGEFEWLFKRDGEFIDIRNIEAEFAYYLTSNGLFRKIDVQDKEFTEQIFLNGEM